MGGGKNTVACQTAEISFVAQKTAASARQKSAAVCADIKETAENKGTLRLSLQLKYSTTIVPCAIVLMYYLRSYQVRDR